jgi:putative copper export protein/mono/diheme cytochrome c family protein
MTSLATTMALLRGVHLAAALSLLGTASFIAWMLPAAGAAAAPLRRRLTRLCWVNGLVAVTAGLAWFGLQTATFVDAHSLTGAIEAFPLVALHTRFGNVLTVRIGLLVIATLLPFVMARPSPPSSTPPSRVLSTPERPGVDGLGPAPLAAPLGAHRGSMAGVCIHLTVALTAGALGLQGFIGHAGATGGAIGDGLVLSEALHLLAAGLWLGALTPLWLSLRTLPLAQAARVCERFSPIGLGCVLMLAGTAIVQGLQLIGSLPALFGTPYGQIALLKIALFLAALTLAAANRLWLTDRLASAVAGARRHLLISIGIETLFGLAIVIAAGILASTMPAAHSVPVWPFSWQFSLITINQDADLRREVILSLVLLGGAVLLLAGAIIWRRLRLAAFAILAATIALRAPSLALLTVAAYPTSFQTSPSGFTAESIAYGQALFVRNCVACHGPEAEGNGPAAAGLRIKPTDLTMPHVQGHSDGAMFWWLTRGIDNPEGGLAMPGFAASMSADDRWALIDYVRAHNAGVTMQRDTALEVPVRAPGFAVGCDGVPASSTEDLRGRVLHVIIGDAVRDPSPVPPEDGIATVTLLVPFGAAANTRPPPGACVAADSAAWNAYAILADLPPDEAAGTEFLVDPNGWLRAVQRPGTPGGWRSAGDLLAAIRLICVQPIEPPTGGQHDHHH